MGVGELLKEKDRVLVEVGAGQSLGPSSSNIRVWPGSARRWLIATLRAAFQQQSDEEYLLERGGAVVACGNRGGLEGVSRGKPPAEGAVALVCVSTATYWIEAAQSEPAQAVQQGKKPDVGDWFLEARWEKRRCAASDRNDQQ